MSAAITIHFRDPDLTALCIQSLLVDGWAPILIWDNSADDGRTLRALQEKFSETPGIIWTENRKNLGFGKGMNAAMAELEKRGYSGPILLVNNDARIIKGMHAALHAPLRAATIPTLVAPRIKQNGREHGWLHYQPWLALVTRRHLPGSFAYLSGCCLLVHRIDNTQPLFDQDFFMYGEDVELSWRWEKQGGKLVLLDEVWLHHAGSASTGQASVTYEKYTAKSHWLLAGKLTTAPWQTVLAQGLRLPSLSLRAVVRALRYRTLEPLRALISIFRPTHSTPRNARQ